MDLQLKTPPNLPLLENGDLHRAWRIWFQELPQNLALIAEALNQKLDRLEDLQSGYLVQTNEEGVLTASAVPANLPAADFTVLPEQGLAVSIPDVPVNGGRDTIDAAALQAALNAAVAQINALRGGFNDLIDKMRAAGMME
jgi:hypothetical protein